MDQQPPRFFIRGPSAFTRFLFFSTLSLFLMASDARFDYLTGIRQVLMGVARPLEVIADSPFILTRNIQSYLVSQESLQTEVKNLNQRLLVQSAQMQALASLNVENQNLRDLLSAERTAKQGTRIAEIMYIGRDPFSQKVVINVGSNQNVVLGQVAIDATGLLGQVTRVFRYTSEVTLLTDQDLSIPIQIERNGLRAIAFGRGKIGMVDVPYLPVNVDIKQGDKLVTSGIDGIYPVGLAVAIVESVKSSSSSPFAKIVAKPLAGVQNHRMILLTDMPVKNAVMEEIKKTIAADKIQQKKSMSTVDRGHEN
jgi:rod shape-determining protein MreC